MSITSKLVVKSGYTKIDGYKTVFLRLTINRKIKYFPLDIFCLEKHWNKQKCRISKSDPKNYKKNGLLEMYANKASKIIFDFRLNDKTLTIEEFPKHFENNNYNNKSFISFVQEQIKTQNSNFKKGTIKGYKDQLNKLQSSGRR